MILMTDLLVRGEDKGFMNPIVMVSSTKYEMNWMVIYQKLGQKLLVSFYPNTCTAAPPLHSNYSKANTSLYKGEDKTLENLEKNILKD